MTVAFRVKNYLYPIGSPSFLNAFFSTVTYRLEHGKRGSVYPVLAGKLYQGAIESSDAEKCVKELKDVQKKFKKFKAKQVVWNLDDLNEQPPWGDNIAKQITDLSNYFVTCDGRDLIEVLLVVLSKAETYKLPVSIEQLLQRSLKMCLQRIKQRRFAE